MASFLDRLADGRVCVEAEHIGDLHAIGAMAFLATGRAKKPS